MSNIVGMSGRGLAGMSVSSSMHIPKLRESNKRAHAADEYVANTAD